MAVQQLHDGEEEEPEADHSSEDAQDKDGGAAVVQVTFPGSKRVEVGIRDPPKSDAGAERGHEQKGDADDNPDVEHGNGSFCRPECRSYVITRCCDGLSRHDKLLTIAGDGTR